jgi:hypothetical protein
MASLKKLLKKRDNLCEELEEMQDNDSYYGSDSWDEEALEQKLGKVQSKIKIALKRS